MDFFSSLGLGGSDSSSSSGLNYDGPSIGQAALGLNSTAPAPSFTQNTGGTNFTDWVNGAIGAINGLGNVAAQGLTAYGNYKNGVRTAQSPDGYSGAANPNTAAKPGSGLIIVVGIGIVALLAVFLVKET